MSTNAAPTQNGTDDERKTCPNDETAERNPFADQITEVAPYARRRREVSE